MISAIGWVPRGAPRAEPLVTEPTEAEVEDFKKKAKAQSAATQESDGESDSQEWEDMEDEAVAMAETAAAAVQGKGERDEKQKSGVENLADGLAELDMDHYDDEDDNNAGESRLFGSSEPGGLYYAPDEEDPYITLQTDEEDEEEAEDLTIKPTDLLILTAKNEDEVSSVEVWVYEEGDRGESNMYVHHEVVLPAFPLALAWLDCPPTTTSTSQEKGNFVAVATMQPEIEIWNLDILDAVEPAAMLGGLDHSAESSKASKKKGKKKAAKKVAKLKEGSHEDSVLGLAWNGEFRNVMASSSADTTVKLWDIVAQKCECTLRHHADKVQAVAWNPREPTVLLTGSFDRTAALADTRVPSHRPITWALSADVECLAWDPHVPHEFVVSTEDGLVRCHDVRKGGGSATGSAASIASSLYSLSAHDKATCSVSFNPAAPHLLATSSTDKMIKLWNTQGHKPSVVASTNLKLGAVFSVTFCRDSPHLLAAGGSKGSLQVWDVRADATVAQQFGSYFTR